MYCKISFKMYENQNGPLSWAGVMFKLTLIQGYPAIHIDYELVQSSANVHVCLKWIIVLVLVICINIFAFEPNFKKKKFLADTCPFLRPLVPLFSGDVFSRFQSQSCFVQANVMYIPLDPPLVLQMPTSWQPATQLVTSPNAS